jgi:hypothetical protein
MNKKGACLSGMTTVILNTVAIWRFRVEWRSSIGVQMSTIGEVRAAEIRVKQIREQLGKAFPNDDTTLLCEELKNATDQYTKAVLELKLS